MGFVKEKENHLEEENQGEENRKEKRKEKNLLKEENLKEEKNLKEENNLFYFIYNATIVDPAAGEENYLGRWTPGVICLKTCGLVGRRIAIGVATHLSAITLMAIARHIDTFDARVTARLHPHLPPLMLF